MKNKLNKGLSLSLSANHISLNKGTFSAAAEVFAEFFNKISNHHTLKITNRTKPIFSTPVILCTGHRIFWQRVSNPVNKFALLLHKYRFTQDSRNKSENDWYRVRLLNTICKFFKFPSPADKSATSPAGGEVDGLLRFARNDDRVWCEVGVPLWVKGNNKQTSIKSTPQAPVILGLVPKIFLKRVPYQVNKFALLFQRSMFTQDSRNKSENDWCRGRLDSSCKACAYYSKGGTCSLLLFF